MGQFTVEVGVALSRPPRTDQYRMYVIEADDGHSAELAACSWAACSPGVVMPTESTVINWKE